MPRSIVKSRSCRKLVICWPATAAQRQPLRQPQNPPRKSAALRPRVEGALPKQSSGAGPSKRRLREENKEWNQEGRHTDGPLSSACAFGHRAAKVETSEQGYLVCRTRVQYSSPGDHSTTFTPLPTSLASSAGVPVSMGNVPQCRGRIVFAPRYCTASAASFGPIV